jgi:DNA polymerase III epsilon subunit-like protein
MSKVIIAGSRSIKDYKLVKQLVDEIVEANKLEVSHVISGRAYGVDRLGEQWATERGVDIDYMPADWDDVSVPNAVVKYNQRGVAYNAVAGHLRNEEMAKKGDILILIHDGESTGSLDMLNRAKKHGLTVFVKEVDVVKHTQKVRQSAMVDAVKWAKEMRADETSLVLDTESCGGNKNDEVISLAIVRLYDGKPMFNSLLRPSSDVKFNWYATQVHGITEDKLVGQPTLSDVHSEVYSILHGKKVAAFNHTSDKRMLDQTFNKYELDKPEINWYCIMKAYKNYTQSPTVTNLTAACQEMNIKAGTHEALDDALAAARLIFRISQEYKRK